jgi:hypothetical protein
MMMIQIVLTLFLCCLGSVDGNQEGLTVSGVHQVPASTCGSHPKQCEPEDHQADEPGSACQGLPACRMASLDRSDMCITVHLESAILKVIFLVLFEIHHGGLDNQMHHCSSQSR